MDKESQQNWLRKIETVYGEPIEEVALASGKGSESHKGKYTCLRTGVSQALEIVSDVDLEALGVFADDECFAFYVWTESRVFFIQQWECGVELNWVPRHPSSQVPKFSGNACWQDKEWHRD